MHALLQLAAQMMAAGTDAAGIRRRFTSGFTGLGFVLIARRITVLTHLSGHVVGTERTQHAGPDVPAVTALGLHAVADRFDQPLQLATLGNDRRTAFDAHPHALATVVDHGADRISLQGRRTLDGHAGQAHAPARQRADLLDMFTGNPSGTHAARTCDQHLGQRATVFGKLAWRFSMAAVHHLSVHFGLGVQQQFHPARGHRNIAQCLCPGFRRQLLNQLGRGRLRTRRHHLLQLAGNHLLHAGLTQQLAGLAGQQAKALPVMLVEPLQSVLHVVEHFTRRLVGVHRVARVEHRQSVGFRVAIGGGRMQPRRIEGGRTYTGNRRSGRGHAAAKRMTGKFKLGTRGLQATRQCHGPIVVVALHAYALASIVEEILASGLTPPAFRPGIDDFAR